MPDAARREQVALTIPRVLPWLALLALAVPAIAAGSDFEGWSVDAGVSVLSSEPTHRALIGNFRRVNGDARATIYRLGVSVPVHEFDLTVGGTSFSPRAEAAARFELIDEKRGAPFPAAGAALVIRWVDFPWTRWLPTTLASGLGLNATSRRPEWDEQKYPGEHRSHVKLYWPVELTLALAAFPQHQLLLFNEHKSGGHIFDTGGYDHFGIGYRYTFEGAAAPRSPADAD